MYIYKKYKNMKDKIQSYLQAYCINQLWIKKQVAKKVVEVNVINKLSIASVKQIIKNK